TVLTLNEPPPDSRKEWAVYSPNPVAFGQEMALQPTFSVGLRDYDYLDPCMIYHAAHRVAILESYAVYEPQIHIYAIAACVNIERYGSMYEILWKCNDLAGTPDVWRLLDDTHDLATALHQKI
ncbi:unnamed protein product, partial [Musa acuminata var. zebrina]